MPPSDFANADIDKVLDELTLKEAILLTAGVGMWYTHPVDRLGIPALKVYVLHILHDRYITLSSRSAMVRTVYEESMS